MLEPITSRQNARVKAAAKLRERRGREEQGRIIIDGVREISRAIEAGVEMIELFVCERLATNDASQLIEQNSGDCEFVPVTESVYEKLAFGNRSEGLVAVARPPQRDLADIQVADDSLVAVLQQVEKPGNIGAVLRSADATGVMAVITADPGTDLFNPNAIRASAGTIFSVPIVAATSEATRDWLRSHGFRILATRVDGAVNYSAATYVGKTAIVLGSEAHGLSTDWQGQDVTPIKLPMLGVADSLNVSVTAAVLFYEALRQRGALGPSP